jgi:hypothetical protein
MVIRIVARLSYAIQVLVPVSLRILKIDKANLGENRGMSKRQGRRQSIKLKLQKSSWSNSRD